MTDGRIDIGRNLDADLLHETERQLFFIVGCGRSGTSLLQAMLASHPEAILPNETGYYSLIHRGHPNLHDVKDDATLDKVLEVVLRHRRIQAMGLDAEDVRSLCRKGAPSWETVFLALLAIYARKHGCVRVGEKSPAHVRFLGPLSERFPNARFIHVVRDPRAVSLSLSSVSFGGAFVWQHISAWRRAIRSHRIHGDRIGPQRYFLIRYEDLVADPEPWLRKICGFLSLDFDGAMLEHHKRAHGGFGDWQQEHMANTLKPVFTGSIDKWKNELAPYRVALIEKATGNEMRAFGYEPIGQTTWLPMLQMTASRVGSVFQRGARRFLRRV